MIRPEVLDAMLKGGCTAEQIVLAVKAAMIGDANASGGWQEATMEAAEALRSQASNVDSGGAL